jgi:amino acid adenylation domain-containing protein/non-ribosomal peptide synthase protein (TIGR01720 family)
LNEAGERDGEALFEPIAIVGMAGRFPGAADVDELWRNLRLGVESISRLTPAEMQAAGVAAELIADPRYVPAKGVLDGVELFDAEFFGFTPAEAELMDPQHRLFLECCWQACEDAGYDARRYAGRIGVYAGAGFNSYLLAHLLGRPDRLAAAGGLAVRLFNGSDFLTTHVSYKLNLRGPSVAVQTACSTSLVAVHLACQALLDGDCEMALAGGVAASFPHRAGYLFQEGSIASPDGHCRAFDARAQGSVEGSGVGAVLLKRLADAVAAGDVIHAVVRGTAVNNDGASKAGFTAPSVETQALVVEAAMAVAQVAPESIGYLEAHGSGTPLGDPIEVESLTRAFRGATARRSFCGLGSIKANIGHADNAAGIASLLKVVQALRHREIPPAPWFEQPNPRLDLADSPFYVATALRPWAANGTPRRAGVSSLGIGGTNAHVILEEAPAITAAASASRPWQLLTLSARSAAALRQAAARLGERLAAADAPPLAEAAHTLRVGRHPFRHRLALVCRDGAEAAERLRRLAAGAAGSVSNEGNVGNADAASTAGVAGGTAASAPRAFGEMLGEAAERELPVVFLLPGLGDQFAGMGAELYRAEPCYRAALDRCAELLVPHLGLDLREVLMPADLPAVESAGAVPAAGPDLRRWLGTSASAAGTAGAGGAAGAAAAAESERPIHRTALAHPAVFAVEYALAELWGEWGIRPGALLGYSLGEMVAACLAGVFSLADGLALVAARARLIEGLPEGDMLAVPLSAAEIEPLLAAVPAASLSAANGPAMAVVGGPREAIEEVARRLAERGVASRRLQTRHAFHTPAMEPIAAEMTRLAAAIPLAPPRVPVLSNVTGTWLTAAEATDPGYWARHLCQTVRFAEGLDALLAGDEHLLLEVGPGQTLGTLARQHPRRPARQRVVASMRERREGSEQATMLEALGRLWLAGASPDWRGLAVHERRRRVALPTYPFERRPFLVERRSAPAAPAEAATASATVALEPAASELRRRVGEWFHAPVWERAPRGRPAAVRGRWLLLLDEAGLGERLARHLEERGAVVDRVVAVAGAGESARMAGGWAAGEPYAIDPRRPEDYRALFAELRSRDAFPDRIVHLWALEPDPAPPQRFDNLESGFFSLLWLGQAIGAAAHAAPLHLAVVASGLHEVIGGEIVVPERAALLGPCRVLPQEIAGLRCTAIDAALPETGEAGEEAAAEWTARLADELALAGHAGDGGQAGDAGGARAGAGWGAGEAVVALRRGHRWVLRHRRVELLPPGAAAAPPRGEVEGRAPEEGGAPLPARLRRGGVYLVTGALEEGGLRLAEMLFRTAGARLVLLHDAAAPPRELWTEWLSSHDDGDETARRVRRLLALERRGCEMLVLAADFTAPAGTAAATVPDGTAAATLPAGPTVAIGPAGPTVAIGPTIAIGATAPTAPTGATGVLRAVAAARERFGALHGVFHAAAPPPAGLLQWQGRAQAAAALAPWLRGTLALAAAVADEPVEVFALSGSIAGALGGAGQGTAAAAAAFLDAFAQRAAAAGGALPAVQAVLWGPLAWQPVSAASPEMAAELRAGLGRFGIAGADYDEAWLRILDSPLAQVTVATQDLAALAAQLAGLRAAALLGGAAPGAGGTPGGAAFPGTGAAGKGGHERPALAVAYTAPRTAVEQAVAAVWQDSFGIDLIGVHDNFFDLSGNSLLAIQIVTRIAQTLGTELTMASLLEAPSIAELAALVEAAAPAGATGTAAITAGAAQMAAAPIEPGVADEASDAPIQAGLTDEAVGTPGETRGAPIQAGTTGEASGASIQAGTTGKASGASIQAGTTGKASGALAPPSGPRRIIERRQEGDLIPLSFDQERLWFNQQLDLDSPIYNIYGANRYHGPIDPPTLSRALSEMVRRHEILRTRFPLVGGQPMQQVVPSYAVVMPRVDLRALPRDRRESETRRWAAAIVRAPFSLDRLPLFRTLALQLAERELVIPICIHHIVTDWISYYAFEGELTVIYSAYMAGQPSPLPELAVQFGDFAVWERRRLADPAVFAPQLEYWRRHLADAPDLLTLPADRPRPRVQTPWGARRRLVLSSAHSDGMRGLAQTGGATLFIAVLAVFQAVLVRLSGQEKLIVGTPIAHRDAPELEAVLGFFINQLALYTDLSGNPTGREVLRRVRDVALAAYAHQELPFARLIDALQPRRDLSRVPFTQVVLLVLKPQQLARPELPGVVLEPFWVDAQRTQFDMTFSLWDHETVLDGWLEYNTDLFDGTTIDRMKEQLRTLLGGMLDDLDRPLWDMPLLPATQRHQLACEWPAGDAAAAPDREGPPAHQLIALQAALQPSAEAVACAGASLTYGELVRRAGRLAARLRRLGVGPEVAVGLCCGRTPEMVVGLLAILQAGGAFLPLDPAYPEARLALLAADALGRRLDGAPATVPAVVLADPDQCDRLRRLVTPLALQVIPLGEPAAPEEVLGGEDAALERPAAPEMPEPPRIVAEDSAGAAAGRPAYVIYTSGTTGTPKGVVVEHGSLAGLLRWGQEAFGLRPGDRTACVAPFSFDIFLFELLAPLVSGATVVIFDLVPALDLERLVAEIPTLTWMHAVPALMRQVAAAVRLAPAAGSSLRHVCAGGDRVTPDLLAEMGAAFPGAGRHVLYGPTEATILCCRDEMGPARAGAADAVHASHASNVSNIASVGSPLGRPIAAARLLLLDRERPAPIGVAGELLIGGPGLARGYLGRPDLTAASFPTLAGERWYRSGDLARHRPDGRLEFLGRADQQVKVRGIRIEVGEVEAALAGLPAVREAVVAVREGPAGKRLVAYVVPAAGPSAGGERPADLSGELRRALREVLPEHLVPSGWVLLPALPLTRHGKVDHAALPAPPGEGTGHGAAGGEALPGAASPGDGPARPLTPAEEQLARIWSEVLGRQGIGPDDNFFALGGDSILSIQVVVRAARQGISLTPRLLFEHQTVAQLAAVAGRSPRLAAAQEPVVGPVPLTPVQRFFFAGEPALPHHDNQALLFAVARPVAVGRLAAALARLVRHHDALRLRFHRVAGGWQQVVPPPEAEAPAFLAVDLAALAPHGDAAATAIAAAIAAAASAAQASLDLGRGPLHRMVLFDLGPGRPGRLLWIIHHLVVDGVSWRILLEDLAALYDEAEPGGAAAGLAPKTTSFKSWAEHLERYAAESQELRGELAIWLRQPWDAVLPLPRDGEALPAAQQGGDRDGVTRRGEVDGSGRPDGEPERGALQDGAAGAGAVRDGGEEADTVRWQRTASLVVDAADTAALLTEVPRAYGTPIQETLLAALARACTSWSGADVLLVDAEGHGREEIFPDVDLSRTVGWFTTVYPLLLDLRGAAGPGAALKAVKEQVRRVPNGGLGFGVLRYLGSHAADLAALPRAEMSFNYLGQLDQVLPAGALLQPAAESAGAPRPPQAARRHLLEWTAAVSGGCLRISCAYSVRRHRPATVEGLLDALATGLRELIAHCRSPEAGGYTPSDFPLAGLDQGQLDRVLEARRAKLA